MSEPLLRLYAVAGVDRYVIDDSPIIIVDRYPETRLELLRARIDVGAYHNAVGREPLDSDVPSRGCDQTLAFCCISEKELFRRHRGERMC